MAINNELLKSLDSTRPNWSFFDDWWKSLGELNPIKKVIKTLGIFQKKEKKKNELQTSSSFYEDLVPRSVFKIDVARGWQGFLSP